MNSLFKSLFTYRIIKPKYLNRILHKPSSVFVNHRDSSNNNPDTPFDFTEENYKKIEEILGIFQGF